jgi:bacillithiol synthase
MIKSLVEPECTGQFSKLFLDYIGKNPLLSSFYNEYPAIENFGKLISNKNFEQNKREVLHQVIKEQYLNLTDHSLVNQQIELLLSDKTFTVTTGHQLNLLTGPLYFIYKIVSTLNLAKKLKHAYPEYHFVPIYWMASEDHDFEEINYFKYEGKKYSWNSDQKGPVGEFSIDEPLKNLLQEMGFVPEFIKNAFFGAKNLSNAVLTYVHALFGNEGLVVVDANHPQLKKQFATILEDELFHSKAHDLVIEQTQKLEDLGYKTQITSRPINLFYMEKGLRERIERTENGYQVLNTDIEINPSEMLSILKDHPEKLSPNVVLRPVYQEVILPNLAYLGGPAEVVYWLQLKPVFDQYHLPFPAIFPRNFAAVVDKNTARKIKSLDLQFNELFIPFDDWKKNYVLKNSAHDITLKQQLETLKSAFQSASEIAEKIDVTLTAAFKASEIKSQKILQHLSVKLRKAEQRKMSDQLQQMEAIKETLFPGGSPQERVVNFLQFYLSDELFFETLFKNLNPFDFHFIVLSPKDE